MENLYLGDMMAASSKDLLQKYGITHILTVAKGHPPLFPHSFKYKVILVLDSAATNLRRRFTEGIGFIKEAMAKGSKVLVHCFAGVSRSATMVIAYIMQEHALSYHSAIKFVKGKRAFINPNDGFRMQLLQFGKELADNKA